MGTSPFQAVCRQCGCTRRSKVLCVTAGRTETGDGSSVSLPLALLWRRGWDSNPRALSDKRFSRPPRYDHFDTSPYRIRVTQVVLYHVHFASVNPFSQISYPLSLIVRAARTPPRLPPQHSMSPRRATLGCIRYSRCPQLLMPPSRLPPFRG